MRGIEKANPETLYGIFGDASWTNKDRLPDSLLRDLIEHFSRINLGNQAAQADILGQSRRRFVPPGTVLLDGLHHDPVEVAPDLS